MAQEEKKDEKVEVKSDMGKNFILSCMVFYDPITSRPK